MAPQLPEDYGRAVSAPIGGPALPPAFSLRRCSLCFFFECLRLTSSHTSPQTERTGNMAAPTAWTAAATTAARTMASSAEPEPPAGFGRASFTFSALPCISTPFNWAMAVSASPGPSYRQRQTPAVARCRDLSRCSHARPCHIAQRGLKVCLSGLIAEVPDEDTGHRNSSFGVRLPLSDDAPHFQNRNSMVRNTSSKARIQAKTIFILPPQRNQNPTTPEPRGRFSSRPRKSGVIESA
jgi:hypothetical protein